MKHIRNAAPWLLPAALTAVAVVWAVAAIGGILTATAHPAFAYSVAVLYDAVWLYALAQETAHRRQGSNARLPKVIGWVFLPLTVAVLVVHGLLAGDALAAVVGGLVPVLAKMTLVMAIDQPWLTAETVVMNDKPWAYGRETRVLLGYGDHLAELTPDNARKALEAMRGFVAQLEAVVDQADASALDDFDGDPEIARLDTQAADRRAGSTRRTGGAA